MSSACCRGSGRCPWRVETAWSEAPRMCCWGDGRSSGQESGGDRKAWRGCVQATEPGPFEPLLCCLMKTALAGAEGQRELAGFCLYGSPRGQLPGECWGACLLDSRPATSPPQSPNTDRAPSGALTILQQLAQWQSFCLEPCVQSPVLPVTHCANQGSHLTSPDLSPFTYNNTYITGQC